MSELEQFNRKMLLHWLESQELRYEPSRGIPDVRDDRKHESRALLTNYQLEVLKSKESRHTNDRIEQLLSRMRKNFYHLWKVLDDLYLAEDADKNQLEKWKEADKGTHNHRKCLWHKQALDLMLFSLNANQERLTVVIVPLDGRGEKEAEKKTNQLKGLQHFFERQQFGATRREAVNETAVAYSVHASTVYRWLEWLESFE